MNQHTPITDLRRPLVAMLPRLRRFALTLVANAAEADELVRETCSRAIQKTHLWTGEGRFETWLFSMMRDTHAETAEASKLATGESPSPAGQNNPAPPLRLPLCLPRGLASAMLLVDAEQFSYAEAATILDIPAEILASRLCAARLHLTATDTTTMERRA